MSRLRTVGGSVMFAIPKAILDGLHLMPDTSVGLTVADGKLIIDPHPRPRYSLAQLLAQCDLNAPVTDEDQAWLNDEPAGREAI